MIDLFDRFDGRGLLPGARGVPVQVVRGPRPARVRCISAADAAVVRRSSVTFPCATAEHAGMVATTLSVDAELQPTKVQRSIRVDGSDVRMCVQCRLARSAPDEGRQRPPWRRDAAATDVRLLRAVVKTVLDSAFVAVESLQEFADGT